MVSILLAAIAAATPPAHASIFDPLLKLLLPFYDGKSTDIDPSADNSAPSTIANTAQKPMLEGTDTADLPSHTSPLPAISLDEATQAPLDPASILTGEPDLFILLQAEFALDRGDVEKALSLYKAESFKQNATAIFERALGLSLQYESPANSLAFAKRWQQDNPDHVPAWFYVAHLALRAEDYDTAVAVLNQILTLEPNADLSQILTGIFPANAPAQRALFNALRTINSDQNVSLSVLKAGLLMQLDEPIAARLYVENALQLEPDNLAILILKANILSGTGEHARLAQFLDNARRSTTGNTQKELYLYEIRQLIDQGQLTDAWRLLQEASHRFSADHELVLLASLVALDIGQYQAANQLLSQLLDDPAFTSEAHYYLGISYERLQNHALALAHYRQVTGVELILQASKKIVAYELMAGNTAAAIDSLIALREQYLDFRTDSYMLQTDILLRQNERQAAITLLEQAVQDTPGNSQLLYSLIRLLDDVDNATQKRSLLTQLLALDPSNTAYQLEQARFALVSNPDDYLALTTVSTISQIGFDSPDYNRSVHLQALQLLAQSALFHGEFNTVINYLQTPYELDPDLNTGILLLRAYQGLGDTGNVNRLLDELQQRFGNPNPSTHMNDDNIAAPNDSTLILE